MLTAAYNIRCPKCFRKLCKVRDFGNTPLIEMKHKGITVLAVDAAISCLECKTLYKIEASTKRIEEYKIGR